MARRIVRAETFVQAVAADLARLSELDREEWFELLRRDIDDVERLVSVFPQAGKLVSARDPRELRKKVLRRTPYVVFYELDARRRSGPVRMLWLVHHRTRGRKHPRW